MAEIHHDTYGRITVRRQLRSKYVRLSVNPGGSLSISAPLYTPLRFIKHFINSSDKEIGKMLAHHRTDYTAGMRIGKSHHLEVVLGGDLAVTYKKPAVRVMLHKPEELKTQGVQDLIRPLVKKALQNEAKAYLPRQIEYWAEKGGFSYNKLRFSHAKGRWGSCSSDRTISLNIALMKLDFPLIDYVIIHELAHTKELNHSKAFWQIVEAYDSDYKEHRKALKEASPHI